MTALSVRDIQRIDQVHPDLRRLVLRAHEFCSLHFMVVEGLRTLAKQREYFAAGKSKTMRSRHLTGHAVDLAPMLDVDNDGDLDLSWRPRDFYPIAQAMKYAANELKIPIEWGGDWTSFVDMPHFQLPWRRYP